MKQLRTFGHPALERHVQQLAQRCDDLFAAGQEQWDIAIDMLETNGSGSQLFLDAKREAQRLSREQDGATRAHRVACRYEMELWEAEVLRADEVLA